MARIWVPGLSIFEKPRSPMTLPANSGSGLRLAAIDRQITRLESRGLRSPADAAEHAVLVQERKDLVKREAPLLGGSPGREGIVGSMPE